MSVRGSCLIFDNNPEHQELTALVLRDLRFQVETSEITDSSFDSVVLKQPSVVILDLQPGNDDAWQLLGQLGANPETLDIPVVCLSTDAQELERARRECTFPGGARFIQKPFDITDVEAAVSELLSGVNVCSQPSPSGSPAPGET